MKYKDTHTHIYVYIYIHMHIKYIYKLKPRIFPETNDVGKSLKLNQQGTDEPHIFGR
jgi:hypothetical protein